MNVGGGKKGTKSGGDGPVGARQLMFRKKVC